METGKLALLAWEITNKCNMYCKHCYRDFEMEGYPELSHEEALELIDQITVLKPSVVTLSGGEAILRDDWDILAKHLISRKIKTNVQTNGWDFTEENIIKAKEAGVLLIGISLDGLEKTHDFFRRKGSFIRVMHTIDNIHKHGLLVSVITTVNSQNILELPEIYQILQEKKVAGWSLNPAMPLGNMRNHDDLALLSHHVDDIIDFAYDVFIEKKINIFLSDCLGYYNEKETEIRSANIPEGFDLKMLVNGCNAGIRTMGILANGNVTGCISLQDKGYIEGNIHEKSLIEIWNDPNSFRWNKNLRKENLKGFCNRCQFGEYCLSGCPAVSRQASNMELVENIYCSYNILAKNEMKKMYAIASIDQLIQNAEEAFNDEDFQLAEIYYDFLNKKYPENPEIINKLNILEEKLNNTHLISAEKNAINK